MLASEFPLAVFCRVVLEGFPVNVYSMKHDLGTQILTATRNILDYNLEL